MVPPLSYPFLRYMESTRHLVLYRLNSSYPIPSMLRLPQVETLCLIDCAPRAVSSILYRPFFPGLRRVHYLSSAPAEPFLYRRFPLLDWVFPYRERPYLFYDTMVEAGKGRMEQGLLQQYIVNWKINNRQELWMDIYLPGKGIIHGEEYVEQQRAYFHKKHCDGFCVPYPILSDTDSPFPPSSPSSSLPFPYTMTDPQWAIARENKKAFDTMDMIYDRRVLNLPDATPFHSSGK